MPTRYKLEFDVPYNFAVEPGYYRTAHCHDMRPTAQDLSGCYQDPLTGLIMLTPSHLTPVYTNTDFWVPLDSFLKDANFWQSVYRGADPDVTETLGKFWSTIDPGSSAGLIPQVSAAVVGGVSLASALASDVMVWVLKTNFSLLADEGFVWNYHALADEQSRPRNWFALSWGGLYLHFSTDGVIRCYRYPIVGGAFDYSATPVQFDSFAFGSPGEILNRDGAFAFIPIPRFGLAVYHLNTPQKLDTTVSSASLASARGHLLPVPLWESNDTTGTGDVLLPASPLAVQVCANLTRMQHIFGMHRIRYEASGNFNDGVFDSGFSHTTTPAIAPSPVPTKAFVSGQVGFSTSLRKTDLTAAWTPSDGRQARVQVGMNTSSSAYTPFLLATNVRFNPVFSNRDTTPVVLTHEGAGELPDRLLSLELSVDEMARFEGRATVAGFSAAMRKILVRGDTTWQVSRSYDEGATWELYTGGLARVEGDVSAVMDNGGMYYVANVALSDMFARFREVSVLWEAAFDAVSLAQAINQTLQAASLSPLAFIPSELSALKLPPIKAGQNFRYAPKTSEHGDDVIKTLLLLARKAGQEWRIKHNWATDEWIAEPKPRGLLTTNAWTATPFDDEIAGMRLFDEDTRQIRCGIDGKPFSFAPMPPEANLLMPMGLTDTNPNKGERVTCAPLYNRASLTDKNSRDYLGRVISSAVLFAEQTDAYQVSLMGRRVFDAACFHRLKLTLPTRTEKLPLLSRVTVRAYDVAGERADLYTELWVKRRTIQIDYTGAGEEAPVITYHLDSRWESEIR